MRQFNAELQYRDAVKNILTEGEWQPNRTGFDSIKSPYPVVIRAHMDDGMPIITGRQAPYKSAIRETVGFLRGVTSAADFRALGCMYWDENANVNKQWLANVFRKGTDDLGDIYGAQWRRWPAFKILPPGISAQNEAQWNALKKDGWKLIDHLDGGADGSLFSKEIDQLGDCVRTILKNPNDRRILFHAWNPAKLDEISLPACHLLYQFVPTVATKELALSVTIRSNDMPLGWPSNVIGAATILHLVAQLTGYKPTWLTIISNDAHIYRNQMAFVEEYLSKPTHAFPTLEMPRVPSHDKLFVRTYDELRSQGKGSIEEDDHTRLVAERTVEWLDLVDPQDFVVTNYNHETLVTPRPDMAV